MAVNADPYCKIDGKLGSHRLKMLSIPAPAAFSPSIANRIYIQVRSNKTALSTSWQPLVLRFHPSHSRSVHRIGLIIIKNCIIFFCLPRPLPSLSFSVAHDGPERSQPTKPIIIVIVFMYREEPLTIFHRWLLSMVRVRSCDCELKQNEMPFVDSLRCILPFKYRPCNPRSFGL